VGGKRDLGQVVVRPDEEADTEDVMIDTTVVRAHQHSAGAVGRDPNQQAIGRSRGGLSTKIHAVTDALGNPTRFLLGQAHDLVGSDVLLTDLSAGAVIADKTPTTGSFNPWNRPESRSSFRLGVNAELLENMTGSCTKPGISLRTSSANSSTSVVSPHAMISCRGTSWPPFSSPPC